MHKSLASKNKKLKFIDKSIKEIKAINFDSLNDYYRNGYVIFYNNTEFSCCVLQAATISYVKQKYVREEIKFYLIGKKDLLLVLEQSFSHLNIQKAQNYLSEISVNCTAKVVDYKKMITGFMVLFIWSLLFFSSFFHVVNNSIYLIQNLLKALLFKRSVDKIW